MTTTTLDHVHDRTLRAAAITASIAYGGVAAFQAALALGAPFGDRVWGGALPEVLPGGWRIASGLAAATLPGMATVVLARAGVIRTTPIARRHLTRATWAIAGFMALNTLGNLASGNAFEQEVLAPLTAVMAGLTAIVARRSKKA